MELNWFIIIPVIIAVLAFVAFLINRNMKDRKALMKKLIEEDKKTVPPEHESETENDE